MEREKKKGLKHHTCSSPSFLRVSFQKRLILILLLTEGVSDSINHDSKEND